MAINKSTIRPHTGKLAARSKTPAQTMPDADASEPKQDGYPADFYDYLRCHVSEALSTWLREHAPAPVYSLFSTLAILEEAERQMTESGNVKRTLANVDELTTDTLKALCQIGATFGNGMLEFEIGPTDPLLAQPLKPTKAQ